MVDGGSTYTLSGTDRPIILDGITGIMTRPEWRTSPSPFTPLAERHLDHSVGVKSHSTTSLESTESEIFADSVNHNVRNTFVQNLIAQTSIVIHKLSLRFAPASLVTFAGKALAFSFYFCPGVAEILVRLWVLPTNNLRHIADEFGLTSSHTKANVSRVASEFPQCLHSLQFGSYVSTVRLLRRQPNLVLFAHNFDWHGPWLTRWSGRDSDLFFVFVKQWHILLEDFLPSDVTERERASSPAFVLVYSQLMSVLQSTIHRATGHSQGAGRDISPATTFDDVLAGANTSAAAPPLPAGNATRTIAENRLIMLLRDVLSEKSSEHVLASRTFAAYFAKTLQAAARTISKYDQDACFALCDFFEEVAYIFARYEAADLTATDILNWAFWLETYKQISESQNTVSEARLFALLYSIWGVIISDERRRDEFCLGWLLTPSMFEAYFCHWCPMSRAYYMRLLCWRIARCDGDASDLDKYALPYPSRLYEYLTYYAGGSLVPSWIG